MKTKTPSRNAASLARLEPLEKIFVKLNPEAEPGDLAAEMVRLLAAPGCVEGARIWKLVDGVPAVWQESGKLPAASSDHVEQVLNGRHQQSANGRANTWALGRGTTPVGVLEIASKSKLDEKTRAWMELFRRYAEVALESSERRNAVIELSTIVEATKRLNSTLDLAELLNIILGLTTRYSGAERGTVFLVDRNKEEIWSLVGLGLNQHEIRLPITKGNCRLEQPNMEKWSIWLTHTPIHDSNQKWICGWGTVPDRFFACRFEIKPMRRLEYSSF